MQAVLECRQCGAALEIKPGEKTAKCKYCSSVNVISIADRFGLYNRANYLRRNNEFDRAISVYEDILKEDACDPEAYYGIALCKYGIEYVEDPYGGGRIPVCHRTRYTPISQDTDFLNAIKYATSEEAEIYREEGLRIDEIIKKIVYLSKNEEKYDIFICYKEGDGAGGRTQTSVYAQEIWQELTRRGYKVFFARKTLESKLGRDYEPIIFSALFSAKIMLVVGMTGDEFQGVWVRNEWSRFLERIAGGEGCVLIPLYCNMSPYELPQEFSNLQSLDMQKIGFIQDLTDGIERILGRNKRNVEPTTIVSDGVSSDNLIKRGYIILETGDFQKAGEYFNRALDIDAENAYGYLGNLLVDLRCKREDQLGLLSSPFTNNRNYELLNRFADEELKARIQYYIDQINYRNEEEERERQQLLLLEEERKRKEQLRLEAEKKAEEERKRREWEEQEEIRKARIKAEEAFAKRFLKIIVIAFIALGLAFVIYRGFCMMKDYSENQRERAAEEMSEAAKKMEEASKEFLSDFPYGDFWLGEGDPENGKWLEIYYNGIFWIMTPEDYVRYGHDDTSKCYTVDADRGEGSDNIFIYPIVKGEYGENGDGEGQIVGNLTIKKQDGLYYFDFPTIENIDLEIQTPDFSRTNNLNNYFALRGMESACEGNLHWNIDSTGVLSISGDGEIEEISDDIVAWDVRASVFKQVDKLEIGEGITAINDYAFYMNSFEEVYISDGVLSIGKCAFSNSNELSSLTIPDSVNKIGQSAFSYSNPIKTIILPASITEITEGLFQGCRDLEEITIPASVTYMASSVSDNPFAECYNLKTIHYGGTREQWDKMMETVEWELGEDVTIICGE